MRNRLIDDEGEALYNTLNQINQDSSVQVIAWNDEPADGSKGSTSHTAHSKGVIAYDSKTKTGFYIAHSTPLYPSFDSNGKVNIEYISQYIPK